MRSLDKALPTPLYHQLKTILLTAIEVGQWKPEERLPAEGDLATRYGVSKITVRQALKELSDLGYIRREQGRGTFVSRPRLEQGPRELTGFTEEMRRHGFSATSRVLDQAIAAAEADVAAALLLNEGEEVFVLKRLRLAGGEPMGVQTAHLPLNLAPGLVNEEFGTASLYGVLQMHYGLQPAYAKEAHCAVLLDNENAELLSVPPGSPALQAERITFLPGGRPLEYVMSLMRGDRYKIVLDLTKEWQPVRR